MALIKTGEPAFGRQIQVILRHNNSASSNGRSIVDGFGISVRAANGEAVAHPFANPQASRMQDGRAI